jgi:hypothetical protein
MAAFVKNFPFVSLLCEGKHVFGGGTPNAFKICLVNSAASATAQAWANYAAIGATEVANGNGYTTGGYACYVVSEGQASGTEKVVVQGGTSASPTSPSWTASGGAIGPFETAVLYNVTNGGIVGMWDYGSSITLNAGDSFTITLDQTNGVFQLS